MMGEFFRGWRRKIGVVTLLMALVGMGGWVRSCTSIDFFCLRGVTNEWECLVISGGQKFCLLHAVNLGTLTGAGQKMDETRIYLTNTPFTLNGRYVLHSVPATYVTGIFASIDAANPNIRMVPYWMIVIPLTLLSAYLLLSKPRKAIHKKTPESTPAEEA